MTRRRVYELRVRPLGVVDLVDTSRDAETSL